MELNRNSTIDVERLKSLLMDRKTTKADSFRIPATAEQTAAMMTAAYMAEVEYRGREFKSDEGTTDNIRAVAEFLAQEGRKEFGMMMCGTCGNGKTTMVYALQNLVNYLDERGIIRGGLVIIDAKDVAGMTKDKPMFNRNIRNVSMMAVEDMGREPVEVMDFGNVANPVIDLMEYRYNEQLFTVVTTNLSPKQIAEKYGKRLADRFNEMFRKIIFKNGSYR